MSIVDSINEIINEKLSKFENEESYIELSEFYSQLKDRGAILKQEFNLPAIDTIGRTLFQEKTRPFKEYIEY
ncbi:MAG: hypothetical protein KJ666_01120 [Bacteroidetes bacterium]|nr:hypothetical protein [Bacteroidota bacterium]MBU2585210.1 hypothetical protein [Bacteroidota bacterium]